MQPLEAACMTEPFLSTICLDPPWPNPLATRKPRKLRKPTLVSVAKAASKAGIAVARYEVKPDGTVVAVVGKPEPTEATNPWLADLDKVKQQ